MKLTLKDKRHESPDAVSFIFQPEKPLTWQAGQFAVYRLPHSDMDDRKDERYFTISSAPSEGGNLMLTTRFAERSSSFKKNLQNFEPGSSIDITGPDGDFTVADPTEELVFIAGGIGITPYRSILTDMDRRKLPIHATLLYANRDDNFIFKDELEALARRHPEFKIKYFVSPQRIDEVAIRDAVPDMSKPVFYVSGPEPMVEAFEKMLSAMSIPAHHIKTDFFPGYDWP